MLGAPCSPCCISDSCVDCINFLDATAVEIELEGYDWVANFLLAPDLYDASGANLSKITGTWSLTKTFTAAGVAWWTTDFGGATNECRDDGQNYFARVILECPGFPRTAGSFAASLRILWPELYRRHTSPSTFQELCADADGGSAGSGLNRSVVQRCEMVDESALPEIFTNKGDLPDFAYVALPYTFRTGPFVVEGPVDKLRVNAVRVYF